MIINSIIINSELDFRKSIISNSKDVNKIIIFEDELDKYIYFYCFKSNNSFLATKEPSSNIFSYYSKIYLQLTKELNLSIKVNELKVLKLIK